MMNSYYSWFQEHEKLSISYHNHSLWQKYLLVLQGNMLVLQKQLVGMLWSLCLHVLIRMQLLLLFFFLVMCYLC